jgi:phage gp46-like protein
MLTDNSLTVVINGKEMPLEIESAEPLVRAVVISLFTWRRSNPDDVLPGDQRMGWWGDSFPPSDNDRIGSRLWLLSRAKVTEETRLGAIEYAQEALQWLVDDGIARRITVEAERMGLTTIALACRIFRDEQNVALDVRFPNVWSFLQ